MNFFYLPKRIPKLVPGRELLIERSAGTVDEHHRRVKDTCDKVAKRTGFSYRVVDTPRGVIVKCHRPAPPNDEIMPWD